MSRRMKRSIELGLIVSSVAALLAIAPAAFAQAEPPPLPPPPPAPTVDPKMPPPPAPPPAAPTDADDDDDDNAPGPGNHWKETPNAAGANAEAGTTDAGWKAVSEAPNNVSPEALIAAQSKASDFMDTRLTWTFGDDDVLHRTGVTIPLSPLPNIGDRPQYRLFFDNLNSRFSGRENLAHLALYKKLPSWIPNLDTEAAVVLRFDMAALAANNNNLNQALYDAGSFLRVFYNMGKDKKGNQKGFGITFFPLDTDRFRLGYLYDISWGGTNAAINQSIFPRLVGASPGMKMQLDLGNGIYIFGGFKTAQIVQAQTNLQPGTNTGNEVEVVRVAETNYGFLGGAGADLGDLFHIDAGAGYFQQGRFEFPDLQPPPGVDAQPPRVFTYGYSARIVFHKDMPVPQSVDFLLYRNDPNAPMMLFAPEKYRPNEFAYAVALEGSWLNQNLHDPDPNKTGATEIQSAHAAAINGIIKAGYARIGLAAIVRDLPFVLRNQPSFSPFEAIDPSARTQNEVFFAGSVDYYIEKLHLRPGISGGLQLPATFATSENIGNATVNHTVVVRQQGSVSILPENEGRKPIVQARLSMRWDLNDIMAAIGWFQLVHDPMQTLVTRDPQEGTVGIRTFTTPNFFGFGLTLQARY